MPDGAEIVSESGSTVTMAVTLPSDAAGHLGWQCPSCKRIFRMSVEDYHASLMTFDSRARGSCCAQDDHGEFMTKQQQDRGDGCRWWSTPSSSPLALDKSFSDMPVE